MATAKGERRRGELVRAAAQLLLSDGLAAVSHRAVAAVAGVPLGTTTYYFDTLDELRRVAVDSVVADELRRMSTAADDVRVRRRSPRATARLVVALVTPAGDNELLAWYERYVGSARQPLLADGARQTNIAARSHVNTVLERSGWAGIAPAGVVLATVDGAVLGSLAEGGTAGTARDAATAVLADLLDRLAG